MRSPCWALLNPGFWIVGLGLELGYLWILGTTKRFQRLVDASQQLQTREQWQAKVDAAHPAAEREDQQRYRALEERCRTLLEQQHADSDPRRRACRLRARAWAGCCGCICALLPTRQAINRILRGSAGAPSESAGLEERIANLQARLKEPLSEDLRKSLTGQIEILQQRLERRREAKEKLAFLDAELTRIQEQVELVREQAVLYRRIRKRFRSESIKSRPRWAARRSGSAISRRSTARSKI